VIWLRVLVLALDIYLLASVAPWLLLAIVEWRLQRSADAPAESDRRLSRLQAAAHEEAAAWPDTPRPGRYEDLDRRAQEQLTRLHDLLAQAASLRPVLFAYRPAHLTPLQVALCRAWQPLTRALTLWRHARQLRHLLDQADDALLELQQSYQRAEAIPARARADLNEVRAEARRLQAVLEAEREEAGTVGLDELGQRLETVEDDIARTLDALSLATEAELPHVVLEADALLQRSSAEVRALDEQVAQVVSARSRAEHLIERLNSSVRLLEERIAALNARGAREPGPANELAALRAEADRLTQKAAHHTLGAYHEIQADMASLDAHITALGEQLAALDDALERSHEAIQGDVRALAAAQRSLAELTQQEPALEADLSAALIERATQSYLEAEQQHALGTMDGYQASLALSQAARQRLDEAQAAIAALPERLSTWRDLASAASAAAVEAWRDRANRVREQLQVYARHWNADLAGIADEAIAALDRAEVTIRRLAPGVRLGKRVRESELEHAIELLSQARDDLAATGQRIEALEAELARIQGLREELLAAMDELGKRVLPEVQRQGRHMLPELRQRLNALTDALKEQQNCLADPAEIDYDDAVHVWLPSFRQQLEELRVEHARSQAQCAELLRDTIRRIDRQWTKLSRLDPFDPPLPEEDVERLGADLEAWRDTAERQANSPVALREILGRHIPALEQRIDRAIEQITAGRRDLEALDRRYRKAAQNAHARRMSIRSLRAESPFPNIGWNTDEADHVWDQALEAESASQAARTLLQACDQMQRAVNAALQAEQLYARIEHQMQSALQRLEDELRGLQASLDRAQGRAEEVRQEGEDDEAAELEMACEAAERGIELAYESGTFEDALRCLRDARDTLNRTVR